LGFANPGERELIHVFEFDHTLLLEWYSDPVAVCRLSRCMGFISQGIGAVNPCRQEDLRAIGGHYPKPDSAGRMHALWLSRPTNKAGRARELQSAAHSRTSLGSGGGADRCAVWPRRTSVGGGERRSHD